MNNLLKSVSSVGSGMAMTGAGTQSVEKDIADGGRGE